MSKTILLMFGGRSPEHSVSISSAKNIYEAMKQANFHVLLVGVVHSGYGMRFITEEDLYRIQEVTHECGVKADLGRDDQGGYLTIEQTNNVLHNNPMDSALSSNTPSLAIEKTSFLRYRFDKCFPCIHGSTGEDGVIQGLLEFHGIDFVGCAVAASALGIDKDLARYAVKDIVSVLKYEVLYPDTKQPQFNELLDKWYIDSKTNLNHEEAKVSSAVIVKAASQGSSISVAKVSSQHELEKAVGNAFVYGNKVLIEQYNRWIELEVAVYGEGDSSYAAKEVAEVEVKPEHEFYTYQAKYLDDGANCYIPARLSDQELHHIRQTAVMIYKRLGCRDLARIDFFMCPISREIFFNEINTMPGFTSISMYPRLWLEEGIDMPSLIQKMLN